MRRASVFTLCLALLLVVGAQVGSASAATVLEISIGGMPIEIGTPMATSSSGMIIKTSAGNITCAESVMEGTITANDSAKDELRFTEALFRQEPAPQPHCESTLALGEPAVTAKGLPWSLDLTKKADGKFKGTKKVAFALAFGGATCVMEGTTGTDTFNLAPGEEVVPLELSLSGLKLKLAKGSGAGCPGSGTFEEPGIAVSDQAQTSEKPNVGKRGKK
jgi:hypothetical protein